MENENRRSGTYLGNKVESLSRLIFPYKIAEGEESLIQLQTLLEAGKGVLLLTNHFSKRDAIQGLQLFLRYLAPYARKTVMPFAKHQFKPAMGSILEKLNVEPYPIADHNRAGLIKMAREIPASERRKFFEQSKQEYENYLTNAEDALNSGGLIGLVAQATREPKLRTPEALPISKLLERATINTENVAIVCVGIGFTEKTDYSSADVRDYNPGAEFTVKIGKVFDLGKLLKDIKDNPQIPTIDHWIHEQLKNLVAPEYLQ